MAKTADIFGGGKNFLSSGKDKTKDIAKKSVEIVKVGLMLGVAGLGLGYGLSAMNN